MAKRSLTKNPTLLRLKGTPFKTAAELKSHEDRILKEEWQNVERARIRRELLKKEINRPILAPFINGFKANFATGTGQKEHLVKIHLTGDESIHVDIDRELRSEDTNGAMESLVRSLIEGFMGGYLTAIGIKDDRHIKSPLKDEGKI